MKILEDKYGRRWLVKRSTYTLLTINHIGVLNRITKTKEMKKLILLLLFISGTIFSQTTPKYTYYVKLNKLLTITKVDTSLYKKVVVKDGEIIMIKLKQKVTGGTIENQTIYLSKEK